MSRVRKSLLDNGIKVITEEMADVESATIGVWVKTGSRNETARVGGISHFIEHMLFKGTSTRNALDIAREIESVGGVLNAFTGREYTCFYAKVLSKDLPIAADLLSDMFINSLFNSEELEREKGVVLQEIKMVEDTPDDIIHDIFSETFWKDAPMGRSVLGTKASVKALKRTDIKTYMRARYNPASVFITVAGGLKHASIVKRLDDSFGAIKARGGWKLPKSPKTSTGVNIVKKDLEQVHICLGVETGAQSDPERYQLYLLSMILGGGMSSRLFQEIREKRGLAYSVYSYLNLCFDTGSLVVYAGSSAESFKEVLDLTLKEFEGIKTLTEAELSDAKNHLKGSMVLGLEATDSRMIKMAKNEIYFGRTIKTEEMMKAIDRVKVSDIKSIAAKLLRPERTTLAAIGNVKKSDLPKQLRAKR